MQSSEPGTAQLSTVHEQGTSAGRDARGYQDDFARDGTSLNLLDAYKLKTRDERSALREGENTHFFRLQRSTLKMWVTLFGCLMTILQLMLFDYVASADKDTARLSATGLQLQHEYIQRSPVPPRR